MARRFLCSRSNSNHTGLLTVPISLFQQSMQPLYFLIPSSAMYESNLDASLLLLAGCSGGESHSRLEIHHTQNDTAFRPNPPPIKRYSLELQPIRLDSFSNATSPCPRFPRSLSSSTCLQLRYILMMTTSPRGGAASSSASVSRRPPPRAR